MVAVAPDSIVCPSQCCTFQANNINVNWMRLRVDLWLRFEYRWVKLELSSPMGDTMSTTEHRRKCKRCTSSASRGRKRQKQVKWSKSCKHVPIFFIWIIRSHKKSQDLFLWYTHTQLVWWLSVCAIECVKRYLEIVTGTRGLEVVDGEVESAGNACGEICYQLFWQIPIKIQGESWIRERSSAACSCDSSEKEKERKQE